MTHIDQRIDFASVWITENPVLHLGEVGWEQDTRKSKVGDGVTPWTGLGYTVGSTGADGPQGPSGPEGPRGVVGPAGPAGNPLLAYPVGSIYLAVIPTSPATLFGGGTWVAWGTGRFPVAIDPAQTEFDTVGEVGGAKTHTLTTAQMPSHAHTNDHDHPAVNTNSDTHTHNLGFRSQDDTSVGGTSNRITDIDAQVGGTGVVGTATVGNDTHSHTVNLPAYAGNTGSAGAGEAHNNLPPYIVCYMWKRTA